jgi:quinoprotein glucose dehydrogenase
MSYNRNTVLARRIGLLALMLKVAGCVLPAGAQTAPPVGEGWPTYGGDPGGTRFSQSSQITRDNLDKLHPVWTFHTRALERPGALKDMPSMETTPVLSGDTLFITSPFDEVFALDARTGAERWHYDPKLPTLLPGGIVTSRGVALWPLGTVVSQGSPFCSQRVFEGTVDGHLLSLDAGTGRPCKDFGENGSVDLRAGIHFSNLTEFGMTSPPTIVGNVVICGSTVADNDRVDVESGAVRGYDAVTGKQLWSWEPLAWAQSQKVRTGAGNTWSVISADPALGLVYLPTGSASTDLFGGTRPGDNRDANSIVALDAATGKKVWAFQVVHHDVWDYDIASEPVLFTWRGTTPAVAVTTKMGMIFLLDRRNGQPLVPVEERPVPQGGAPGEQLSPTQPFQNVPSLIPLRFNLNAPSDYNRSSADAELCRKQFADIRYEGLYTPPSLKESISYPGNLGGVNWGGAALDPSTGVLYANTNRLPSAVRLVPRHSMEIMFWDHLYGRQRWLALFLLVYVIDAFRRRSLKPGWPMGAVVLLCAGVFAAKPIHDHFVLQPKILILDHFGWEHAHLNETQYVVNRHPINDSQGFSCAPTPWGSIAAVNLNTLASVWEKPLGSMVPGIETGATNFGGPIVTASGLVITAATEDAKLRIFDAATGAELRSIPLPMPAIATPMTYTLDGRQYIVISDGGHGDGEGPLGDSLMAFAIN